ncbi:hypothetical protein HWV62_28150 [Athelia sp. TMB]|nr:hypothetical protein HWV62_28150 [Athelia sp. TMB]
METVAEFTSNRQDWADFGRFMQNSITEVIQYLWDKDASQRRHTVKTLDQFLNVLNIVKTEIRALKDAVSATRIRPIAKDTQSIAGLKTQIDASLRDMTTHPKYAREFHGDMQQLLTKILKLYKHETTGDSSPIKSRPVLPRPGAPGNSNHGMNSDREAPTDPSHGGGRLMVPVTMALDKLSYAEGASWDPELTCLRGTRVALLQKIDRWARSVEASYCNIFWIKGLAGSGKSAIAHTIAQMLYSDGFLASSFFFNLDIKSRNTIQMLFTTIARDIASRYPDIAADITAVLENELSLASASPSRQFEALIAGPLRRHHLQGPVVVVIDALDESSSNGADAALLELLSREFADLPPYFRVLITSRPTSDIERIFSNKYHIISQKIDIDSADNWQDITFYVHAQLRNEALRLKMGPLWPDEALIRDLITRAGGLFIWIATIFSYLRSAYNPKAKLSALLSNSIPRGLPDVNEKMDALYTAILDSCGAWSDADFLRDYHLIMGAIMGAKRPLSLVALRALCDDIGELSPNLLLERFGSVLVGLHDENEPIRIVHLSFREFITDRASENPGTQKYSISEKKHSRRLAALCLNTMARELPDRYIVGAGYLDQTHDDMPGIPRLEGVSEQLLYGCESWTDHVFDFEDPGAIFPHVQNFLLHICKYWLEIVASRATFRGSLVIRRWLETYTPEYTHLYIDKFQARMLSSLGKRLSFMGRFEEGLLAMQEAAFLYRGLSLGTQPVRRHAVLAWSLNDISIRLSSLGRREEALATCQEALELYKVCVAQKPAKYKNGFASCINNLSNYLSDLGRPEEGLKMCQQAVSLQRSLARERPDKLDGNLAASIASLSNRLSAVSRQQEALTAIQEAVDLYHHLVEQQPALFNANLAMALRTLASRLSHYFRHKEAVLAIEKSVHIYRDLVAERPLIYTVELAKSLDSLSTYQLDCGWRSEGLQTAQEAVRLHRELAQERPASSATADLAFSLRNLSAMWSASGDQHRAMQAMREAVDLLPALAADKTSFKAGDRQEFTSMGTIRDMAVQLRGTVAKRQARQA